MDAGDIAHNALQATKMLYDRLGTCEVLPVDVHAPLGHAVFQGQKFYFKLVVSEAPPDGE